MSNNLANTQGTIDGHDIALTVFGDPPDELIADIEAALADVKADREATDAYR